MKYIKLFESQTHEKWRKVIDESEKKNLEKKNYSYFSVDEIKELESYIENLVDDRFRNTYINSYLMNENGLWNKRMMIRTEPFVCVNIMCSFDLKNKKRYMFDLYVAKYDDDWFLVDYTDSKMEQEKDDKEWAFICDEKDGLLSVIEWLISKIPS